jgi:MFS family permease
MTTATVDSVAEGDRLARRNARLLAVCQALAGGNSTVTITTGGIIGAMLAPEKGLATLPISALVFGMWVGTLPIGYLARTYGRRAAFQVGTVLGISGGLLSMLAVLRGLFGLLLVGTFCNGLYAAAHQAYRFAAADTASDAFKPKAVSWVMAGGVFAGVVGPQLVIWTKDLWQPYLFAATYLGQAGVALLVGGLLTGLRIPRPPRATGLNGGRPLIEIISTLRFITAAVAGAASYAMMNLVMTSAPLAMVACDHSITDATLGLQWHVLAMYAPSFFTGALAARFGLMRVMVAGFFMTLLSAVVFMTGLSLAHFWIALILLGLGWNLSFIAATTLVTQCHTGVERNKVQAFNDFLVFGSMAVASFSSGNVLAHYGWQAVNAIVFPVVGVALVLIGIRALRERRIRPA